MYASSFDPRNQPLFHIRGFPVWLSTMLVIVHCVMLVVIAGTGGWLNSRMMLHAYVPLGETSLKWPDWWQWGTYFLCNSPSFWFLLNVYFLWVFGRQLEQVMGRQFLGRLYTLLVVIGPVVVAAALLSGLSVEAAWAGPGVIHFSIFMAIAFLEPNAPVFITSIKLKYLAAAFFAINMLQFIQTRNGVGCVILTVSVAATYLIMRRYGLTPRFARVAEAFSAALPRPRRKSPSPALRYEPKMLPRPDVRPERRPVEKIDAILEKISRSGLESLDEWERRELERASSELKRQDG